MTVASQCTSSPRAVMVKVKNAQHAFSRAARSRTHASVPGWARNRKQIPAAVFSRPIRGWLNRGWASLRGSGPRWGGCGDVHDRAPWVAADASRLYGHNPRLWTRVQGQGGRVKIGEVARKAG